MTELRKLAAILVADVVGYSRLAAADEEDTLARLRALRNELVDPAIAAHRGRIVKRTGDGAIVEFRSAVDAVRCAIELQRGLIDRNACLPPEKRIELRVGVHVGDVVEESDGDLMGDGVNIAARLEGIAAPGGICLSEQAYWQVKGRVDLAVADLGNTHLKNIAEPIRVYALRVGVPATTRPAPEEAPSRKHSSAAPLAAGIAASIILITVGAWYFHGANRSASVASNATAPAEPARLSIVVLPFANLGDPAQNQLADALTDGLTTGLARIPGSSVAAIDAAFAYKGKPIDTKAIGKDLGVRYVLQGSVLPSGSQVRVKAELTEAESGERLWADHFDAGRGDPLSTQDEIVSRLARTVVNPLFEAEAARLERAPAASQGAEDLALRCRAAVRKGKGEAGFALCGQALDIEPNNVHALVWLATKSYSQIVLGGSPDPDDLERADLLVSKALVIDPNYGREVKGEILRLQGRVDEAIAEFERALVVDPTNGDVIGLLANAYWLAGRFEESLEYFDKALRLGPNDQDLYTLYQGKARAYFGLKNYDQAIEWSRRTTAVNRSGDATSQQRLISALALAGRQAEAREALRDYLGQQYGSKTIAANRAAAHARFPSQHPDPRFLDYFDRFLEGLREAGMPEA